MKVAIILNLLFSLVGVIPTLADEQDLVLPNKSALDRNEHWQFSYFLNQGDIFWLYSRRGQNCTLEPCDFFLFCQNIFDNNLNEEDICPTQKPELLLAVKIRNPILHIDRIESCYVELNNYCVRKKND